MYIDEVNNYFRICLHCFVKVAVDVIVACSRFSQLGESILHKDRPLHCQPPLQELHSMNAAEAKV